MSEGNEGAVHLDDPDDAINKMLQERWEGDPEFSIDINIFQKMEDGSLKYLGRPSICDYPDEQQGSMVIQFKMEAGWMVRPKDVPPDEQERQREKARRIYAANAPAALATIQDIFSTAQFPVDYAERTDASDPSSVSVKKEYEFELPKEKFYQVVHAVGRAKDQLEQNGIEI
jgi:hypothetical protein